MKKYILQGKKIFMENKSNMIFVIIFLLIIYMGFLKVMVTENIYNQYEYRYSVTIPNLTFSNFSSNEFQNNIDLALADQLPKYDVMKMVYNFYDGIISYNTINLMFHNDCDNSYVPMATNLFAFDCTKHLVYPFSSLESNKDELDTTITNFNKYIDEYKDMEFYLYYINKDTDIDFTNNQKNGIEEYIKSNIHLNENNISSFAINNFEEYDKYFFKSDHHWNHEGSYKGYTEIIKMLDGQAELIKPNDFKCIDHILYGGSKSKYIGGRYLFNDDFCAYIYDLENYKTYVNGHIGNDGQQTYYLSGQGDSISYREFYGNDDAEVIFDFNQPDKKNLLIIGNSFTNPINELIASHFNKTYDIDLRYNKDFRFKKYVEENKIDIVLFMGDSMIYTLSDFRIKG